MRFSLELDTKAGQLECTLFNVTTGHSLTMDEARDVFKRANDTLDLIEQLAEPDDVLQPWEQPSYKPGDPEVEFQDARPADDDPPYRPPYHPI